jgi:hypothetical protein
MERAPDTWKRRTLGDSTYEILKNYYSREELEGVLRPLSADVQLGLGRFYWWASGRLA